MLSNQYARQFRNASVGKVFFGYNSTIYGLWSLFGLKLHCARCWQFAWLLFLYINVQSALRDQTNEWFQAVFFNVLRGGVARKFNDKPNWNMGKDARFPAPGQRNCQRLIKKHLYHMASTTYCSTKYLYLGQTEDNIINSYMEDLTSSSSSSSSF